MVGAAAVFAGKLSGLRTGPRPWAVALVLVLTTLVVHTVALVGGRLVDGVDMRTHYQWSVQFLSVLQQGTWYPRWMPLANGGLGEAAFVVIQPGWYAVMALLQTLGLDTWLAMRAAAALSTLALGAVVFWLLRPLVDGWWALGGAVLLQALPFAAFQYGFHAALPWHFSFPIAALVTLLTVLRPPQRLSLALAGAVALLVLFHIMVAFMTLLCLGAVVVARGAWQARRNGWRALPWGWLAAVVLGGGMSCIYWLLVGTSGGLFKAADPTSAQALVYLNWRNSFTFPFVTSQLHGTRWAFIQWVQPLAPLAALLVGAWAWRRGVVGSEPAKRALALLVSAGWLALVLSSEAAYPLYATLPVLPQVQWPYRFLTVAGVCGAMALVLVLHAAWSGAADRLLRAAALVALAASLALLAAILVKQWRDADRPQHGPALMQGLFGQAGAEPATVGPQWQRYLERGGLAGFCARAGLQCSADLDHAHHRRWTITAQAPVRLLLPVFAFPAWQVSVNGQVVGTGVDGDTGVITLPLLAGKHVVALDWRPLWQERVGAVVSALSLALFIALALWRRRSGRG